MSASSDSRRSLQWGYTLLVTVPFLALALTFADPPQWLQIVGVVALVAMVGTAATMVRRQGGGWRPSETLNKPHDDGR